MNLFLNDRFFFYTTTFSKNITQRWKVLGPIISHNWLEKAQVFNNYFGSKILGPKDFRFFGVICSYTSLKENTFCSQGPRGRRRLYCVWFKALDLLHCIY